ncbi:RES family NAD+ phosphorylase [Pseudomonas citronellolis]|uniref:RES family NAD+ phosphorylase n=1 Tax=Pseudomonas citronellolis TaxID=53408 RepID=UPI0015F26AF8|nr:RES family NAD+ phosphorylase [Pseudomonas citronellolis]
MAKIISEGEISRCSYCGTNQVSCIDPASLADKLELFTYGLSEDVNGRPFSEILAFYGIFSDQVRQPVALIDDIFGVGAAEQRFQFDFDVATYTDQWEEFKVELKHKNRFFPKATIHSSLFSRSTTDGTEAVLFQLLEQLKTPVNERESFFRARISETPLGANQMGCPPRERVTGGRANPLGIPYLYAADSLQTCISEVRPSNSSCVYVSEITPARELSVLDLTSPRKLCSASAFGEEQLSAALGFLGLLELFSEELSKPIRPENGNLDYIPTQFLCEFIKSEAKFDGLIFNSSFGSGKNYVFFDGDTLVSAEPQKYVVNKTVHEYELG